MKKQGFIQGSAILIISVILTKIIGALFKIPLTNLIGGCGMGYFSSAYGIFMPVYAVSITGLPAAIAKITAENNALKKYKNVRKIKSVSIKIFSVVGLLATIVIMFAAFPFCKYIIETPAAFPAVFIIAPSIFFGCIMSVYRGYSEGLKNMYPTAISQVIEAVVKLFAGLLLSWLTIYAGKYYPSEFFNTIKYLGASFITDNSNTTLNQLIIAYSAAAAILGVTLSSFIGMLYTIICCRNKNDEINKNTVSDTYTDSSRTIAVKLAKTVVPIALSSLIINLTSLIDLATITRGINDAIKASPLYFSFINLPKNEIANFYYGCFTGLSITVFNLVPSFTNMFGKGIIPTLTEAWTLKDKQGINNSITSVLTAAAFIALPCGISIFFLSNPILSFLFTKRTSEILISYRSLSLLAPGIIFLSITVPVFAMFQAIGKAILPVKIMAAGVILKLIGNLLFVPVPELNINGAAISTSICYAFILITSLVVLLKITNAKIKLLSVFAAPLFSALMCAVAANLTYFFTSKYIDVKICLFISIIVGFGFYMLFLYLLGFIDIKKLLIFIKKN